MIHGQFLKDHQLWPPRGNLWFMTTPWSYDHHSIGKKMENPFGMNLFEARRPRSEITETVAFHHDKTTQARAWTQGQVALQIKTNTMISWRKFTFFHNDGISRMQHFFSWPWNSNQRIDHWIADLASTISFCFTRFSSGKYRVSIQVGRTWIPNLTWNAQIFPFPWHGSMGRLYIYLHLVDFLR